MNVLKRNRGKIRMLLATALSVIALSGPPLIQAEAGSASGATVAHRVDGEKVGSAAINRVAPKARMFRIPHGTGEPTLGITARGNVFITTSDSCVTSCTGSEEMVDTVAPGGRAVFATFDKGKTWKEVTPNLGSIGTHVLSMDPYIYVDESTSRIFDIDLTVACSILSYSDEEGASWVSNHAACGEPINDHQTVFAGPPVTSPTIGYPNIVYYCFNHPAFTKCSKSLNGGLTFIPTANIFPPSCSGLNGHGITDKKGTIFIPMGTSCGDPVLAISKDEGDTWKVVTVAPIPIDGGGDPSVAIDRRGNLYYLFVGNDRLPYVTISRDKAKTWSDPIMVGAPGVRATNLATIDVGDPGKIAIAYYGTEEKQMDSWNGYLSIGKGLLDKHPLFYTASINDNRHPLKVNGCGPGRCGRVLDFIDVEISPQGRAWGAYVDACLEGCERSGEESIHDNQGVVGTLVGGFKLHADGRPE